MAWKGCLATYNILNLSTYMWRGGREPHIALAIMELTMYTKLLASNS